MAQLVHEFVGSSVRRFGDSRALTDANGSLTYNEMWDRSRRLATGLRGLGVQRGDRVVALMHNRNEWVEVDNAVSMIGGVRGRLNARDSLREFAWVLNDLRPSVVVTSPEFTKPIQELVDSGKAPSARIVGLGDDYERLIGESEPFDPERAADDEPYLVFHTSGTTGNYKGAVYQHRQWVNIYRNILATMMNDVDSGSALLHVGPLSHQSGILTAPALFHGGRSVMMTHFDAEEFFETVERERITHTILAPAIINALTHHPAATRSDLSSLRRVYYSGSPIASTVLSDAMKIFGPVFFQGYGSTEGGTIYNTILYPDEHVEALEHRPERLASCGRPSPFFDVKIADDEGTEVATGDIGELWVRGDAVSVEYWNQPEATARAYVDGWFRMGDLATADEDGYITIVDRKNDMIISGGLNVYPREVEDVITAHPDVNEVAVVGVPHEKWGEAVHACVSLRSGSTLTLEQLQQHCRDSGLATYKKPLSLEVVDEIPKTAVGKVFRRAMRERHWEGHDRRVG
ncbi:class I adenylate-forming enzyme family protein [Amycolatopsis echigonensis]|uniref:AMP-binding protein n=1 Tax=Amycolatopsis echigonensis TaxID=2576905 RepID=A0A8E1W7Y1_9PSEU|nr:AMP-binding protein [Amycolatopsis echigonensis]MBB2505243.1 AMP-binding protein [Amycolatopsis echigonensis]